MREFGSTSTTDEVLEGIDLTDKTVLITGANSGLGFEAARAMASKGASVVLIGRDKTKVDTARAELEAMGLIGSFDTCVMDLADLESVRAAAADVLTRFPRVNILLNNAGIMAPPTRALTKQGFESQFGTNHLGHFLFTCLIAPCLIGGSPSRVINLSSGGHLASNINLDDPNFESRPYDKWQAYGASKTANVQFTVGLEKRLQSKGVHSIAVHPGFISTHLGRDLEPSDVAKFQNPAEPFKEIPQGAATGVCAATSPEFEGEGGIYLLNCGRTAVLDVPDCGLEDVMVFPTPVGVASYALSEANADALWTLSEALVGQTFNW